jgi:hypothetical protein
MRRKPSSDQYVIPFELEKNDLLAQVRLLRQCDLAMSPGRSEGVVQLLERLILLGNDLREMSGVVRVKAQVIAIAARVDSRSTVADKTVRNWARDAKSLGVLAVDVRSHKYGRKEWNLYEIQVDQIRNIIRLSTGSTRSADTQPAHTGQPVDTRQVSQAEFEGGNGRKWAETVTAPRPVMVTDPGAEMVTAPLHGSVTKNTHTPLALVETQPLDTRAKTQGEVVSVFLRLGVGRAMTLVADAIARGCDTRSLLAIARWYDRSQRRWPTRWTKPATVLMLRLTAAQPGVPSWLGWIPGTRPKSVDSQAESTKRRYGGDSRERIALEMKIRKAGRAAGASIEEIDLRVEAALAKFDCLV